MKIEVNEESFSSAVAEDLIWHAKSNKFISRKLRKSLERVAMYYMTHAEAVKHFGQKKADKYFGEEG